MLLPSVKSSLAGYTQTTAASVWGRGHELHIAVSFSVNPKSWGLYEILIQISTNGFFFYWGGGYPLFLGLSGTQGVALKPCPVVLWCSATMCQVLHQVPLWWEPAISSRFLKPAPDGATSSAPSCLWADTFWDIWRGHPWYPLEGDTHCSRERRQGGMLDPRWGKRWKALFGSGGLLSFFIARFLNQSSVAPKGSSRGC